MGRVMTVITDVALQTVIPELVPKASFEPTPGGKVHAEPSRFIRTILSHYCRDRRIPYCRCVIPTRCFAAARSTPLQSLSATLARETTLMGYWKRADY